MHNDSSLSIRLNDVPDENSQVSFFDTDPTADEHKHIQSAILGRATPF